jgi:alpha-tubulin suppressor-like RCC1 family protein
LGVGSQEEARSQLQKVAKPPGVTAWTDIAGGYMHSMAIGNDCSLYAWGANDSHQLGLGQVPAPSLPQRVPGMDGLCGIPVVYTQGQTTQLEDGSFRLRFDTSLNRSYQIQYSDDVQEWRTVFPALTGSGGVMEWIDDGPPKSWKHPAAVGQRFYRVIFTPSQ